MSGPVNKGAVPAEPVAWRVQVDGLWFHARDRDGLIAALGVKFGVSAHGLDLKPLYDGPQATPPAAPSVKPSNVGQWCMSEDECRAAGIDVAAYERGVSDAAEAFGRNK